MNNNFGYLKDAYTENESLNLWSDKLNSLFY